MARVIDRGLWLLIGAFLLVLPALPIARWTGAPDPGPDWQPHLSSWFIGIVTVVVIGLIAGRGLRHSRSPGLTIRRAPVWWVVVGMALVTVVVSVVFQRFAMATSPQSIDEIAQLFQAKIFLAGRLAAPVPPHPEFFLFPHSWITDAGWTQQFPPAHAVMLAVGMFMRLEWLVNPVLGGLSTVLVFVLARGWYDTRTGLIASFLWMGSAWVLFMSASFQNHVTAAAFALVAWTAVWGPRRPGPVWMVVCGVATAIVAAARPLDAVAVACPIAVWMLAGRRWMSVVYATVGGLPIIALWFYANARLYGSPTLLGYSYLYGAEHGLGFHEDVYGLMYTPWVALSNMASAVRRLHINMFEWPVPAALPLALWALLAHHRVRHDRYLALALITGPILYFFYWHSGFYPGPRFYYIAAPALMIGTARMVVWSWKRVRRWPATVVRWDIAAVATAAAILVWGFGSVLPMRFVAYREGRPSLKLHPERTFRALGIDRALVLVPESWGSRVIVDLWSLGTLPGVVERAYRYLDVCDLQLLIDEGRADQRDAAWIEARLTDAINARVPTASLEGWRDRTVRFRTNRTALPPSCEVQMQRDVAGYALYSALAWRNAIGLQSEIVFARDLFDRNPALLEHYVGWPLWRFAPAPGDPDGEPVLRRLAERVEAP